MLAKEIKKNDIFVHEGHEYVAIDDYVAGCPYFWVTSRERWVADSGVYNHSSACVVTISDDEEVEYVGKMQ